MATLTISRDRGWSDRIRRYQVLVDGEEIGQIGNGQVIQHEVTEGRHTVQAKIDWCGSREFEVDVDSRGAEVYLRSALRGWRVGLGLFYVLFNRQGYIIAEQRP